MKKKHWLSFPLLIFAAGFLSACDPIARPYNSVDKVLIDNSTPVLHVSKRCSWGIGCNISWREDRYFSSDDFGETWSEIPTPPVELPAPVEQPASVRLTACALEDPQTCYRITGKPQVEASTDGGKTWEVAWKMPAGRGKYMQENPEISPFMHVFPDTIPYDLGIVPFGPKHIVIVAMGNQGLLVRSPDGVWERRSLSAPAKSAELAYPLPFYAASFNQINDSLSTEIGWAFLATFTYAVVLTGQVWRSLSARVDPKTRTRLRWSLSPFLLGIGGSLMVVCLAVASLFLPPLNNWIVRTINFVLNFGVLPVCLVPVIGLVLTLLFLSTVVPNRVKGLQAALWILAYALLFFAGIWFPLALWAIGAIPFYEIALGSAILISLLILVLSFRATRRLVSRAVQPAIEAR